MLGFGKEIDLDNEAFAINNPIIYNNIVIAHFRRRYGNYINRVFQVTQDNILLGLSRNTRTLIINDLPKEKIERHLFPFFAVASSSGTVRNEHINFCANYILLISFPVLTIDKIVDENNTLISGNKARAFGPILASFTSIYVATTKLCENPKFSSLLQIVSNNYSTVFQSIIEDIYNRYNLSYLDNPRAYLQQELSSPVSQLTSKYFETSLTCALLINEVQIHSEIINFAKEFGRLRQIIDQIADIREDITVGKITFPILFALIKDKNNILKKQILDFWCLKESKKRAFELERIIGNIKEFGGYDEAYNLSVQIYNDIQKKFINLPITIGSLELKSLILLKKAYLERIKRNNWKDVPNCY